MYRTYLVTALLLGATISAAEKPVMSKGAPPKPISFSASPILFVADGVEHAPRLIVTPQEANYTITGTSKASKPGDYTFIATAGDGYAGTLVCKWRIVAPVGTTTSQRGSAVTIDVQLLLDGKVIGAGKISDQARQLKIDAPDHELVATATFSRSVARDAHGNPLHAKGDPQWKSYGLLKPASGHGEGCVLCDGASSSTATLRTTAGTYTLALIASTN